MRRNGITRKTDYEWSYYVSEDNDEYIEKLEGKETYKNLCLERSVWLIIDGVCDGLDPEQSRTCAVVEDGKLPATFINGKKIPKRYIKELEKYSEK